MPLNGPRRKLPLQHKGTCEMKNSLPLTAASETPVPSTGTSTIASVRKRQLRRFAIVLWIAVAIVTAMVYLQPVRSPKVYVELMAGCVVLWCGALLLARNKALRITGVVLPLIAVGLLLLPGRHA